MDSYSPNMLENNINKFDIDHSKNLPSNLQSRLGCIEE